MSFCISHVSAAQFWIWARQLEGLLLLENKEARANGGKERKLPSLAARKLLSKASTSTLPQLKCTTSELQRFGVQHDVSLPMDILVSTRSQRRYNLAFRSHFQGAIKSDTSSFIELPNGNLVSSPALCLLQLAPSLDFLDLMLLAYEFCGRYVLDPSAPRGFVQCAPILKAKSLKEFASNTQRVNGVEKLRKCCEYLVGNSRSPMETGLSAMLSLPGGLGYGLSNPQLNRRISLSTEAQAIFGRSSCECDLFWPGLDVEYDSNLDHAGDENAVRDSLRASALAFEGIEVVHLYRKNIDTLERMDSAATLIAQKIGQTALVAAGEERAPMEEVRSKLLGHHSHPF